ncbi:extracellular solute-binding protein [Paenibacillus sp. GYB003]|uniref:extracellular solute-binding protein n=1 Tax=Paenibacillus sp. GYB003 TaxID=2994392 RepID=UPI002F968771
MNENAGKRNAALLTLLPAFGIALGACGGSNESAAPKMLSVSMYDRGQVSSEEGTYRNNRWVERIREQSGIYVHFVPVPRMQAQEKLNIMFAAGDAPDLIWDYDRKYIGMLASQGVIQPVDDFLEAYSTAYKSYLREHPELKPYLSFNGKMYAVATKRPVTSVVNHGIWIRQDWLDNLGLAMPRTIDELLDVAKAFRSRDPDGNGQDDTVAIVGRESPDIYAALYGIHRSEWFVEDGSLQYGPTTDRYKDAIRLEKQLYDEGLIDTEGKDSVRTWVSGKAGICLCQWSSFTFDMQLKDLLNGFPAAKPVPLEPVETERGVYGLYQEEPPFIYVAFNKKMKDPETAVKYLDWMLEKGWKELAYGTEGVHVRTVNGIPQTIDAEKYRKEVLYASEYAVLRPEIVRPSDWSARAAPDPLSQRVAGLQTDALRKALNYTYRRDLPYQPSFVELNEAIASVGQKFEYFRLKAVREGPAYTPEWAMQEIRKEWRRIGGVHVEALVRSWYETNKAGFPNGRPDEHRIGGSP